ncbi:MAG: hypothetical protein KC585_00335 [Candidatus Magasanikbacteria bacterium]|nr:hypothetical protein [Candidatus Magasanikbacteria bacterium]
MKRESSIKDPAKEDRISGIQEAEYEDVDFGEVTLEETPEQAEYRRIRNAELIKATHDFDQKISDLLERRWMEGQSVSVDYAERLQDLSIVNEGEINSLEYINGGANGTRLLFLTTPNTKKGDTKTASMPVFEKSFGGEKTQIIDPATGDLLTLRNNWVTQPDGTKYRQTTYARSGDNEGPATLKREKIFFKSREMFEEAYQANFAKYYAYPPEQYPVDKTGFGLRHLEVGKTLKREYVCAAIDALFGLHTVPTTTLITDGEELYSRQKGILKTQVLSDPEAATGQLIGAVIHKEPHPAKQSLVRLAVLHDLVENTDGHLGNILLDKPDKKGYQELHGIDFGYSLPLHTQLKTGEIVSSDPIKSGAIQLVELDPDLRLDNEAMNTIKTVYEEVKDYLLFKSLDKVDSKIDDKTRQRLASLSDTVKSGETAKLLYELLAFAFEVEGKPEITRAITKKEFSLFMGRVEHILETGRPRMPKTDFYHGKFARIGELQEQILGEQKTPIQHNLADTGAPGDEIHFLDE